jgi:hypothetical protein
MEIANKGAIERAKKKDGDIPTLVALIKDGTPDAREKAATALRNLMSDNAANREAIAAAAFSRASGVPSSTSATSGGTLLSFFARSIAPLFAASIGHESEERRRCTFERWVLELSK